MKATILIACYIFLLLAYGVSRSEQVQEVGDETRVVIKIPITSMYTGRTDYQSYSWTIREALQIRAAIDTLTGAEAVALPAGVIQIRYGNAQGDSVVAEQVTFTPSFGEYYHVRLGGRMIKVKVVE